MGALVKERWRKGYRLASEGCSDPEVRSSFQAVFRDIMTGNNIAGARESAEAVVTKLQQTLGDGRSAHALCHLALAHLCKAEGNLEKAIYHFDWATILGGVNEALITAMGRLAPVAKGERVPIQHSDVPVVHADDVARNVALDAAKRVAQVASDALDVHTFRAVYHRRDKPVVIQGMATTWPAFRKWTSLDYLSSVWGHRVVPIEVGRSPLEAGRGWEERAMRLDDFLRDYLAPSNVATKDGQVLPPDKVAYCAQHPIFDQIPELREDIREPAICASGGAKAAVVNCWFGTKGTTTPLHFDRPYDNVLVQVVGAKVVRLFSRSETPKLMGSGADGDLSVMKQGNVSPVDVECPDHERFPLFKDADFQWCLLLPGDALYIPAGHWHHVRSLSTSMSVNFWF